LRGDRKGVALKKRNLEKKRTGRFYSSIVREDSTRGKKWQVHFSIKPEGEYKARGEKGIEGRD